MAAPDDIEKLRERSITKLNDEQALDHIGTLIDAAGDAAHERAADRALHLLDELAKRDLTAAQGAILEYFRANAWSAKGEASGERRSWAWALPNREQEILALSRAVAHPGFVELDNIRRSQILTNRASQLNAVGRFVDAIEGWDAALRVTPKFAAAQANRGFGLRHYAGLLRDDRERAILLLHAYDGLVAMYDPDTVFDEPFPTERSRQIVEAAQECAAAGDLDQIRTMQDLDGPSLGRSKAERAYRRWCLDHRLFLNPINDLGAHTSAALDDLILPSITEGFDERPGDFLPPPVFGFFNQMKQEYASVRFLLYQGMNDTKLHYSDLGVRLFDTLDYPAHSLATERIRTAFRIAYSLLDKVAFLIDHYWKLGKTPDRISFKSVWMVEGKARLLDRFSAYENWPLRGLYWTSRELFDDQLKKTTGFDARELHDIRNALEHKFLQLHEGWAAPFMHAPPNAPRLAMSMSSDLLEAKALRVVKIARSALIQLALAIGIEERTRSRASPSLLAGPLPLHALDDRRKRRDPL